LNVLIEKAVIKAAIHGVVQSKKNADQYLTIKPFLLLIVSIAINFIIYAPKLDGGINFTFIQLPGFVIEFTVL